MKNFKTLIATVLVAIMALTPVISLADINFADPYTYTVKNINEGNFAECGTNPNAGAWYEDYWVWSNACFPRDTDGLSWRPGTPITLTAKDDTPVTKYLANRVVTNNGTYFSSDNNTTRGYSANKLEVEFDLTFKKFADDAFVFDVTSEVEAATEQAKDALYDYTLTSGENVTYYKQALPYDRYHQNWGTSIDTWKAYTLGTGSMPSRSTGTEFAFSVMRTCNASGDLVGRLKFEAVPAVGTGNIAFKLSAGDVVLQDANSWFTAEGFKFNYKITADLESKAIHYLVKRLSDNTVLVDKTYDITTHPELANKFFTDSAVVLKPQAYGEYSYPRRAITLSNYKYTLENYKIDNGAVTETDNAFTSTVKLANNYKNEIKTPMIIAASYDNDGKLVATQILGNDGTTLATRTVTNVFTDSEYKTYDISVPKTNTLGDIATKAKVFVWKDAENMVPLTDVASYGFAE